MTAGLHILYSSGGYTAGAFEFFQTLLPVHTSRVAKVLYERKSMVLKDLTPQVGFLRY